MRRTWMVAGILGVVALGVAGAGPARADSLSIGVQTSSVNLGINIGAAPPPLVVVPAPPLAGPPPAPVYVARDLPYNYFVYKKVHYLYHEGRWFRARRHDGPWTVISIASVPRPILAVPVDHYRARPDRWEHHGPPPWVHERERERQWERGGPRGHDRGDDRHGRGPGKGRH